MIEVVLGRVVDMGWRRSVYDMYPVFRYQQCEFYDAESGQIIHVVRICRN